MDGSTAKKIGIFGGSFDPPHKFHLAMAARAYEYLGLDLLVFVPAASSPPKFDAHFASFADRAEMLKLALDGFGGNFEISDIETRSHGISYAADTAEFFAQRFPNSELYWLIGADMLASLVHWKGVEKLSARVQFACFDRGGETAEPSAELPQNARIAKIPCAPSGVSSSEIRGALARGDSEILGLSRNVLDYVLRKRLYRKTNPLTRQ